MEPGDDGRTRTGTLWSAIAHAITATIGSGILALPWSIAQLGWILGPFAVLSFAFITYYTAILLCDLYRSPDPVNGRRNPTYHSAVRAFLGQRSVILCTILQYAMLWGTMVGYTITVAISIAGLKRTICHHEKRQKCSVDGKLYMLIYGLLQIVLSQFPNLEKITLFSIVAALTSFGYSFVALCLSVIKLIDDPKLRGSLMAAQSMNDVSFSARLWFAFQSLGNIAFAYTYSMLLLEIQDTLKSPPPENKVMKRVTLYSICITASFYILLGCMAYMAFGSNVPGNILAGFYDPFWLVSVGHLCVIVHLIGAYPVFAQPIFAMNETWFSAKWPAMSFFNTIYSIKFPCTKNLTFRFTLNKLLLRPVFVMFTTAMGILFPFFTAILGLVGAISFWPMTVYFPVRMYIVRARVKRGTSPWIGLQLLSVVCLVVTLIAAMGSFADILGSLKHAKLLHIEL